MLKKTNEAKNSYDQLQWEGEKTRQQSKGTTYLIPAAKPPTKQDVFVSNFERQYLKSLYAENNMVNVDCLNYPDRLIPSPALAIASKSKRMQT